MSAKKFNMKISAEKAKALAISKEPTPLFDIIVIF